jgi:hypothetical protein
MPVLYKPRKNPKTGPGAGKSRLQAIEILCEPANAWNNITGSKQLSVARVYIS